MTDGELAGREGTRDVGRPPAPLPSVPRRRLVGRAVVVTLLAACLAGVALPASPAGATSSGQGWTLAPAPVPGHPDRPSFDFTLPPGGHVSDKVALSNDTDRPLPILLYASDARNAKGSGSFALGLPNQPSRGVGRWTITAVRTLTVPPKERATIAFTLSVPAGATPGDYAGGIVALDTAGSPATHGRAHLNVVNGVGARIYLRVVGPLRPGLALGHVTVTSQTPPFGALTGASRADVRFPVSNTGNESLDVVADVRVVDGFGRTVKEFAPKRITGLLPGSTVTVREPSWTPLPIVGREHVEVTVTSGSVAASGEASFWVVPWALLVLVAVLLAGAVVLVVRRRRRRHRHSDGTPVREGGTAAPEEAAAVLDRGGGTVGPPAAPQGSATSPGPGAPERGPEALRRSPSRRDRVGRPRQPAG